MQLLYLTLQIYIWSSNIVVLQTNFKCIRQVMYMYLPLPKDAYDVGTPVAPEEKNIVDMPAMNFCFSVWSLFMDGAVYSRISW